MIRRDSSELILVDDADRGIVQFLRAALRELMIDKRERPDHQRDQHTVVAEGAELLGAEPEYVGDRSAHAAGSPSAPACAGAAGSSSVSTGNEDRQCDQRCTLRSAKPQTLGEGADADLAENSSSGRACPITAPAPDSDETGVSMPENWVAGSMVRIAVPNSAAIWVRVNDEISMP